MKISKFTPIIFCLLFLGGQLYAEEKDQLKDYLWKNNFKELIGRFSEENVVLVEKGRQLKKLEARSFTTEPGYRLQLFAGTNQGSASRLAGELRSSNIDSVYIAAENGIFKVQLGNYREKREAEKMLDKLRFSGFGNAWIVGTEIHVPKSPATPADAGAETPDPEINYAIQIFVTNDLSRAEILQKEFSANFSEKVWIKSQSSLYKLLVGRFAGEQAAREFLNTIKQNGYPDAWITQINGSQ